MSRCFDFCGIDVLFCFESVAHDNLCMYPQARGEVKGAALELQSVCPRFFFDFDTAILKFRAFTPFD